MIISLPNYDNGEVCRFEWQYTPIFDTQKSGRNLPAEIDGLLVKSESSRRITPLPIDNVLNGIRIFRQDECCKAFLDVLPICYLVGRANLLPYGTKSRFAGFIFLRHGIRHGV